MVKMIVNLVRLRLGNVARGEGLMKEVLKEGMKGEWTQGKRKIGMIDDRTLEPMAKAPIPAAPAASSTSSGIPNTA